MNKAAQAIILQEIKEQYPLERDFYERQLGLDEISWIRWKKEEIDIGKHAEEKMLRLFTDYERMLVQKVARNAEIVPDVQMNPVREYKLMKLHIARQWLQSGLGDIEWVTEHTQETERDEDQSVTELLQVELDYQYWSYKDRLEFRLRHQPKKELRWTKPELIYWMDQKIEEHTTHPS